MRKFLIAAIIVLLSSPAMATELSLKSAEISDGTGASSTMEYNAGACHGENRSPELSWSGEPDTTQSFVVSMFDPDAPYPGGWLHWMVLNIPADTHVLRSGAGGDNAASLPEGVVQLKNSYGTQGYGGPCPPRGDKPHRYEITLYAMPQGSTNVPVGQTAQDTVAWLKSNALASSQITLTYQRN